MRLLHPLKMELICGALVFFHLFTSANCCNGGSKVCAMSEMTCSSGKCISLMRKCDGIDDCGDESDELNCRCGYKPHNPKTKNIVGGRIVKSNDWPWMAAIITRSNYPQPVCGGTLISRTHILTAAHCFDENTKHNVEVRLGEYDFNTTDDRHMDFVIEKIIKHEHYNFKTLENNIAIIEIIRMEQDFPNFIGPACLSPNEIDLTGEEGIVLGWGQIFLNGPSENKLQSLSIPVWNQNECTISISGYTLTSRMMCAGETNKRRGICLGDEGGPFMSLQNHGNKWFVTGIASWNDECAENYNPSVFTKVKSYIQWILDNTCPSGYKGSLGYYGCLKVHKKKSNWETARKTCQNEGGDLFSPGHIHPILPKELNLNDDYWILVRRESKAGSLYKRVSGNSVIWDNSTLWYSGSTFKSGDPSRSDGEECVKYSSYYEGLRDLSCNDANSFICEILI